MKHLAAYLLLTLGGNESPSEKDITALLESVGVEPDKERLSTLMKELKDKDIKEVRRAIPYSIIICGLTLRS